MILHTIKNQLYNILFSTVRFRAFSLNWVFSAAFFFLIAINAMGQDKHFDLSPVKDTILSKDKELDKWSFETEHDLASDPDYDPDVVKGAPVFPEPMVFDLVRPLGARKSEFEVNVLSVLPLKRRNYNVDWAPEVEWAFANGYAFELELPMHNGKVEAYKMAFQGTFSFNKKATFIHGWQWIGEYVLEGSILENSLLYLAGYDLGAAKSVFCMLGARNNQINQPTEAEKVADWNLLFNVSLNHRINKRLNLSIENNYSHHFSLGNELLVIPQIHCNISEFYNFQIGMGYQWSFMGNSPMLATRFIREF